MKTRVLILIVVEDGLVPNMMTGQAAQTVS